MANKVQFGLKNCYYSKVTFAAGSASPTFATPVAIPGGVNLNLSAQGSLSKFYADNMTYYSSSTNDGYEGDLEVAKIPDEMLKDIFGYTEGSTSKVLTENASAEPAHFALLFQIEGDTEAELYVLYNCVATRPAVASGTIAGTKTPVTQSMTVTAAPLANGKVMARTTGTTGTSTRNSWFSTVFVEA